MESCKNCKFSRTFIKGGGKCVRFPPQALLTTGIMGGTKYDDFAVFPRIRESDWCGEYKNA